MLDRLSSPGQEWHASIQFCYWLQYHLHKQLLQASQYAGHKHVALKGDLPIGALLCPRLVYSCARRGHPRCPETAPFNYSPALSVTPAAGVDKCSVDTWLSPKLFRMDVSTGAATAVFVASTVRSALSLVPRHKQHTLHPFSCCRRPSRLL